MLVDTASLKALVVAIAYACELFHVGPPNSHEMIGIATPCTSFYFIFPYEEACPYMSQEIMS